MSGVLENKVAIVTGGGRGLGRVFSHALGEQGANVVVASRKSEDLAETVNQAAKAGYKAAACVTDVTSEDSVQNLIDFTVEKFGGVDIVVNNSGVVLTTPLIDQTVEEWESVIDTNLRGMFLVTRAAGRQLIEQGRGGKVINIASNFGLKGIPNHVTYSTSKAGVVGFTRSAAIEWARNNIQVNAIAPGYFITDMNLAARENPELEQKILKTIPARRMADAAEIGPWIVALAGPASDFMTGEVIVIDGGQTVQ